MKISEIDCTKRTRVLTALTEITLDNVSVHNKIMKIF